MHLPHKLLLASLTFSALTLTSLTAEAQSLVFHNNGAYDAGSLTSGDVIGASLITGNQTLDFSSLIFPQQNGTVDEYVPHEQFFVAARNADGTVGTTLYDYTHFTLKNDSSNGQTTVSLVSSAAPVLLLPTTGYWFVVYGASDPTYTQWAFATSTDYRSSAGITIPADDAAFGQNIGFDPQYFNLADGPQMLDLYASPAVAPEPSTWALLGVGSSSLLSLMARRRLCRA